MAEQQPTCAVCPRAIRRGYLMCYGHWRKVPDGIQRCVNDTWSDLMFGTARQTLAARQAYVKARQAAIDAVRPTAPTTATTTTTTPTGEPT